MAKEDKLLVYVIPPVEALVGFQIPISECRNLIKDLRGNDMYPSTAKLLAKLDEIVGGYEGL